MASTTELVLTVPGRRRSPEQTSTSVKRARALVSRMFTPVRSPPEQDIVPESATSSTSRCSIAFACPQRVFVAGPQVTCMICECLEFKDLEAVTWCSRMYCVDLEVRFAFILAHDACLATCVSTVEGGNMPDLHGSVLASLQRRRAHSLKSCCPSCVKRAPSGCWRSRLAQSIYQVCQSAALPPACPLPFGAYWRCMAQQQQPTRPQLSSFTDYVLSLEQLARPMYVFLSPVAGMLKRAGSHMWENTPDTCQYRVRYGILDHSCLVPPVTLETQQGETLAVPPTIIHRSSVRLPRTAESVEGAILSQLLITFYPQASTSAGSRTRCRPVSVG